MYRILLLLILLAVAACNGVSTQNTAPTLQATKQAVTLAAPEPTAAQSEQTAPAATDIAPTATTADAEQVTPADPEQTPTNEPTVTSEPATTGQLPDPAGYTWETVVSGLEAPLGVATAGDERLFVVEQPGRIRIIANGQLLPEPFLDISNQVIFSGERGLLGLAFHPDYPNTPYFYVNYIDRSGNTVIAQFQVSPDDPNRAQRTSETQLLYVEQPYANHNGGQVIFGPDGYLYLGLGDGGAAGDPQGNAQNVQNLLGTILRLDVSGPDGYSIPPTNPFVNGGGQPEIWAYGLRNPWRFTFDPATGDLYIADVGQNQWEEVNFLPANAPPGANFGWDYFEGTHPYEDTPPAGLDPVMPVAEYDHSLGCSVTGGVVYRGQNLPQWQGVYLYGDYCSGRVWGLLRDDQGNWQNQLLFENQGNITAFGYDPQGELLLVDGSGTIKRLVSTTPTNVQTLPEPKLGAQEAALLPGVYDAIPNLEQLTRYTISATVNADNLTLDGLAVVDYTNTEDQPLDSLYFRLLPNGGLSYGDGSLSVSQVQVDAQSVEPELSLNDSVLLVPLPDELAVNARTRVEFAFSGQIPQDFGQGPNPPGYGIYNATEGVIALSGWYPQMAVFDDQGWNLDPVSYLGDSVYADASLYRVTLTAPADQNVVATGQQVSETGKGSNVQHTFVSGPARDFFIIMSPTFESLSETVDGTEITSYYLPGDQAGGELALQVASDSLDIFNQRFGSYPYTELDVVDAPMRNAAGVEFPGVILVAGYLYDTPERPDFTIATAHEVAHQWWYNVVGNDVFDEPWVDEALTSYSSSLYFEDEFGPSAAQGLINYWQNRVAQLNDSDQNIPIDRSLSYFENLDNSGLYGAIVYSKGPLFFRALRQEIGDQAFFTALQDYYQLNRFGIGTGQELLQDFERAAGRNLDQFYARWLSTSSP